MCINPNHQLVEGRGVNLVTKLIDGELMTTDQIVKKFWNMVYAYAYKMRPNGNEIEDLAQEGFIGLLRAYEDFDPERGLKFSTFAGQQIRFAMMNSMRGHYNGLKWPNNLMALGHKIIREDLVDETPQSIAEKLGEGQVYVERALEYLAYRETDHLDRTATSENGSMLIHEFIGKPDDYTPMEINFIIERQLTDEEKYVLGRHIQGDTQRVISKTIGKSQMQVSRILNGVRQTMTRELMLEG